MSRKYDPQRVFNHKRTNVQQKGQSYQVKLLDEAPPRVDENVLDKAYRLCLAYNKIPQPVLVNLPVEGELTLGFDQFFAAGSRFYSISNPPIFNGYLKNDQLAVYAGGIEQALDIPIYHFMVNTGEVTIVNVIFASRTSSSYSFYYQIIGHDDTVLYQNNYSSSSASWNVFDSRANWGGVTVDQIKYFRLYTPTGSSEYKAFDVTISYYKITLQ